MFVAHALGTANISLVLAFAPTLQQHLHLEVASFGLAVSCYYAAQTVAALPSGWLVDRFGMRSSLIAAQILLAAGMGQIAIARGWLSLSAGLVLCGFGYALINPATARGVLAWFDKRNRATAMGIKQTGVPIGAAGIAAISGLVAEQWRLLAIAMSVAMLLGAVLFRAFFERAEENEPRNILRDIRRAAVQRRLVVINLGGCLYNVAFGSVLAYIVTYAYEELGTTIVGAGLLIAVIQGASAVARILWGIAGDAIPGNGRVVGLVTCGVLGAVGLMALPYATSIAHLNLLAVALGLTVGGFGSLAQTHAVESVRTDLAGAAVGFNSLLLTSGMMIGPALFAYVINVGGYALAFCSMAIALLIGAALFLGSGRLAEGK